MALLAEVITSLTKLSNTHPAFFIFLTPLILLTLRSLYRISPLHPLFRIPGPVLPRLTSIWLNYHAFVGDEATTVHKLHEEYGPIVRTGPNSVDISDGAALHTIYVEKGGFLKPAFYGNFDIDGHKSIFSEIQPGNRAPRAKAVTPIFSTGNLRNDHQSIDRCVDAFVARLRREIGNIKAAKQRNGIRIDILGICRALAIDVVTSYLFGVKYEACEEDLNTNNGSEGQTSAQGEVNAMTASAMVDSFVAVGKFWYLPSMTFQMVERLYAFSWPDAQADRSIAQVDVFVAKVVEQAQASGDQDNIQKAGNSDSNGNNPSYPVRLLQAKFSESEVHAQCKDLIFAGTDSTAMNLATIIFHLLRSPSVYAKLKAETVDTAPTFDELQSLPYLRGVIREGLRMAMANPSRLPRVVPPSGWSYTDTNTNTNNQPSPSSKTHYLSPGTIVSCTPYSLHFNPEIYPDPFTFNPERWIQRQQQSPNPSDSKHKEEMNRDFIPFGLGSRQCIARNLATLELFRAVRKLIEDGVLEQHGMKTSEDEIEIKQWFNSHVVGGRIDVEVS